MKNKILILFFTSLFALPRFSVEEGGNCMSCHINPTGGGMRNDHGTNVYNLDELTLRNWISDSDEDWDGFITDNIQIGGEFRIQFFNGNSHPNSTNLDSDDDGKINSLFPMQAEIYTKVDINKNTDFYLEASLGGSNNYEYFILFDKLPQKGWIKVGQSSPNYGLMVDDHTSFIKSGNKNSLYLVNTWLDRGFRNIFNPMIKKPLIIEGGFNFSSNLYMTMSLFQPLSEGYHEDLSSFSGSISYINSFGSTSLMLGSSILEEDKISLRGVFGGISFRKITMMFETDLAENLLDDVEYGGGLTSIASYAQFTYKPIQGLHLIAKYDYFDHNYDFTSGSISRYSYGLELYPLNMLEIKMQMRDYKIDGIEDFPFDLDNEYLIQVHTWF